MKKNIAKALYEVWNANMNYMAESVGRAVIPVPMFDTDTTQYFLLAKK
jgi:hypothetical protein